MEPKKGILEPPLRSRPDASRNASREKIPPHHRLRTTVFRYRNLRNPHGSRANLACRCVIDSRGARARRCHVGTKADHLADTQRVRHCARRAWYFAMLPAEWVGVALRLFRGNLMKKF